MHFLKVELDTNIYKKILVAFLIISIYVLQTQQVLISLLRIEQAESTSSTKNAV
jgi:hypothetical protein